VRASLIALIGCLPVWLRASGHMPSCAGTGRCDHVGCSPVEALQSKWSFKGATTWPSRPETQKARRWSPS